MPPRPAPSAPHGRGRGGPPAGGSAATIRPSGPFRAGASAVAGIPDSSPHIKTIGVKRAAFGSSGKAISIYTNHFPVEIPKNIIHHYDVIGKDGEKTLPSRFNMEIIKRLQVDVAPEIFTPKAVYDGRKNIFAARELPFGETGTREFSFTLEGESPSEVSEGKRGPKTYKVKLTHVAKINPEVLLRFLQGKQSHDNDVLTAITALNVVIRMEPSMKYPFNVRSFFTNSETLNIGGGIVLWRGYFQSVRPAIGRMVINMDISTAAMYEAGRLIDVARNFFGRPKDPPHMFAPTRGLPERERIKLQRFLSGVRVEVKIPGQASNKRTSTRTIKKLTTAGANQMKFINREGKELSVAEYFAKTHNYKLLFPDNVCVEVGSGAIIPMECCTIPEGQIMRKQIPADKTKDVVGFATQRPADRLDRIKKGLGVLAYGQSEYVREFGMHMLATGPQEIKARMLDPPTLQYGGTGRQSTIKPHNGQWNMIDKKFFRPAIIRRWMVVIFERESRYTRNHANELVDGLLHAFTSVGIACHEDRPHIAWLQVQQDPVSTLLKNEGRVCAKKNGGQGGPDLVIAVLPEASTDLYQAVKHFGDITQGVATQCLKSSKCKSAKDQYFANVCLKINVKLGGINTVPEARSIPALTDPHNPTVVMGADVIHPAPGAIGRPSFTALVGNVDSDTAKYVADCRVQTSRQEMIDDLQEMAVKILNMYMSYRSQAERKAAPKPKRIIFYRDGVSEGQFQHVLDFELPQLKAACQQLGIQASITVIVVGKRHHVRFFPKVSTEGDKSGNCPAGTVVDRDITHPTEFDFYLQSHSGVLYDENRFTPDSLQALSFALCHVYARSTRSVSIPAPVYYADIVCARARIHYDPEKQHDLTESATPIESKDADDQLEVFKRDFKPLNTKIDRFMYFS